MYNNHRFSFAVQSPVSARIDAMLQALLAGSVPVAANAVMW
jgi:hypothetical protein